MKYTNNCSSQFDKSKFSISFSFRPPKHGWNVRTPKQHCTRASPLFRSVVTLLADKLPVLYLKMVVLLNKKKKKTIKKKRFWLKLAEASQRQPQSVFSIFPSYHRFVLVALVTIIINWNFNYNIITLR